MTLSVYSQYMIASFNSFQKFVYRYLLYTSQFTFHKAEIQKSLNICSDGYVVFFHCGPQTSAKLDPLLQD